MYLLSAIIVLIGIIYYAEEDNVLRERRAPIPKLVAPEELEQLPSIQLGPRVPVELGATAPTVSIFTTPAAYVTWNIGATYTIQLNKLRPLMSLHLYSVYPDQRLISTIVINSNSDKHDWFIDGGIVNQGYYQILYSADADQPGLEPNAQIKEYSNVFYISKTNDNCQHPQFNEPFDFIVNLGCTSSICQFNCSTEYLDIFYVETNGNNIYQSCISSVSKYPAAKTRYIGSAIPANLNGLFRLPYFDSGSISNGFLVIVPRTPADSTSRWKINTASFMRQWNPRDVVNFKLITDVNGLLHYNVSWSSFTSNDFTVNRVDLYHLNPLHRLFTGTTLAQQLMSGVNSTLVTIPPHMRSSVDGANNYKFIMSTSLGLYSSAEFQLPALDTQPTISFTGYLQQQSSRKVRASIIKGQPTTLTWEVSNISNNKPFGTGLIEYRLVELAIDLRNGNDLDYYQSQRVVHFRVNPNGLAELGTLSSESNKTLDGLPTSYTFNVPADLPSRDDYVFVAVGYIQIYMNSNNIWTAIPGT
eukprot:NODE_69_length_23719_cov_0.556689.p4 type:complete len:529 gc:universal NODE_69_length_23719_cov_0.556689:18671-17085(-)